MRALASPPPPTAQGWFLSTPVRPAAVALRGHRIDVATSIAIIGRHVTLELDSIEVRLERGVLDHRELLVRPDHHHARIACLELLVSLHTARQRLERMLDHGFRIRFRELCHELLEVGFGRLRARANRHGDVLVESARWLGLVQVWAGAVHYAHEHADAVRAADVHLGAALVLVRHVGDEPAALHRASVHVFVVEALGAHVLGQRARIGVEPGDAHGDVVVDLEQLLLERGELVRRALERSQHHVRVRSQPESGAPLLDGLARVLDLE
mmetsp:Transcript_9465/g.20025  ORF Transcript_9465/g.20025 Transcript_9465/m.20025 type:complete len:268 (-) Transcript_9465:130-933(-)